MFIFEYAKLFQDKTKYYSLGKEYNEKDYFYENLEKNQLYFNDSRNFNDD